MVIDIEDDRWEELCMDGGSLVVGRDGRELKLFDWGESRLETLT